MLDLISTSQQQKNSTYLVFVLFTNLDRLGEAGFGVTSFALNNYIVFSPG